MLTAFITNLGKYNEGELIGKWINFPISEEELQEVFAEIGINEEYEEFFFTDYEDNWFNLGEYESIDTLNEIGEILEDMEDSEEVFQALLEDGYDIYEAIEIVKECDYMFYDNCNDMTDVAYKYIEQTGMLDNVPEFAQRYFDYEQFGRDMDIEGHFYECGNGFIEVLR